MPTPVTDSPVALGVLRAVLHDLGSGDPTGRELRAAEIVAAGGVRWDRKGWRVRSQSGDREYRVRGDACDCPDKASPCKHATAAALVAPFARELGRRLGREVGRHPDHETAADMLAAYTALVARADAYRPPPAQDLLHSFRLEGVDDDVWHAKRQADRHGAGWTGPPPDRPWVAHVTGLCPRYEFRRWFLRGLPDYRDADKVGRRGVYLYFALPPGLYEVYERDGRFRSRRFFARVAGLAMPEIDKDEVLRWLTGAN